MSCVSSGGNDQIINNECKSKFVPLGAPKVVAGEAEGAPNKLPEGAAAKALVVPNPEN